MNVVDGVESLVLKAANAHDVTYSHDAAPIPEFPTIAIPVIAVLGLAFIFQRRKD